MGEEEIALILRTEVSQNSISEITSLETRISAVKDQLKGMTKAGEQSTAKFQELKTVEKALTAEKRKLNRELNKSIKDFEKFGTAIPVDSVEGMAREAADLRRILRIQSKEVRTNDKVIEALGITYSEAEAKSKKLRDEVREADKALGDYSSNIGNYASTVSGLGGIFESISGVSLGFVSGNPLGSISEVFKQGEKLPGIFGKVSGAIGKIPVPALAAAAAIGQSVNYAYQINEEFDKLRSKVGLVTQASGSMLVEQTASIKAFSDTFEKGFEETLEAAQAISQGFGISIEESMDLLTTGALSGADAFGELLQKSREYPKVLANAGYSAEDFIKIITQEVRGGIYDDKLTDAIKEAGLSLTEFTKAQKDALADSFGDDFANKLFTKINDEGATTKDIIGEITKEAEKNGLTVQQMATVTADIFKGAGEDAGGLQSIMDNLTLAMAMNIEELVDEQDDYTAAQIRTLEANERLATAQTQLSNILGSSGNRWKVFGSNLKAYGTELMNDFIVKSEVLFSYLDALVSWDSSLIKTELEVIEGATKEANKALEDQNKIQADQSKRSEEIEARKKRLEKAEKEREKNRKEQIKLEEKAAKESQKLAEERLKNQEIAGLKIIDLNNKLIEDEFAKREAIAQTNTERAILSLVGTPEQIAEQKDLLKQQLESELEIIAEAKQKAIDFNLEKDREALEKAKLERVQAASVFSQLLATSTIEDEKALQEQLKIIGLTATIEQNKIKLENDKLSHLERLEFLKSSAEAEKEIALTKNAEITEAEKEAQDARQEYEDERQRANMEFYEDLGGAIGNFMAEAGANGEEAFKNLAKTAGAALLELIEKQLILMATAALSGADSIATFGGAGLVKIGIITGLIKGAVAGLKGIFFEQGGAVDQAFSFPAKTGGTIKGPSHNSPSRGVPFRHKKTGRIGYAEGGEMILNKSQQIALMSMAGNDIFARAGVPGGKNIRVFAGGGTFIPNVARLEPKSGVGAPQGFGEEQIMLMASVIGAQMLEMGKGSEERITKALIASSDEKNKRDQREYLAKELNSL